MRQVVAFYDHETGEITAITQGSPGSLIAHRQPFVLLPEYRPDWDLTHIVVDDQLAERPAEGLAALRLEAAMARLRERRDGYLRSQVDPLVTNPLRWAALSPDQQAAMAAYRQALLDWPEVEADPLNPTPPTPPEI